MGKTIIKNTYMDGTVTYEESDKPVEFVPLGEREGVEGIVSDDNGFSALQQTRERLTLFVSSKEEVV